MKDNLLEQLHASGLAMQAVYIQLQHIVKIQRMQILKLGASTGGATYGLLDVLKSRAPNDFRATLTQMLKTGTSLMQIAGLIIPNACLTGLCIMKKLICFSRPLSYIV